MAKKKVEEAVEAEDFGHFDVPFGRGGMKLRIHRSCDCAENMNQRQSLERLAFDGLIPAEVHCTICYKIMSREVV